MMAVVIMRKSEESRPSPMEVEIQCRCEIGREIMPLGITEAILTTAHYGLEGIMVLAQ